MKPPALLFGGLLCAAALPLHAQIFSLSPSLPPADGEYLFQTITFFSGEFTLLELTLSDFSGVTRTPAGLDTQLSYDAGYSVLLTGGLGPPNPYSGSSPVAELVSNYSDGDTGTFNTEMLSLNLSLSTFMVRESPTLISQGATSITPMPGGYQISSFFDVFTELSTDGGNTWVPADGASHGTLMAKATPVPETEGWLLTTGAGLLFVAVVRRLKTRRPA